MPTSHSEQLCKDLLDYYLPINWRKQNNLRPNWLYNPKTGRRLELDRFYPDQKLAIEFDGIQHRRYIEGIHKDFQAAVDAQARDMTKIEQCKSRGIRLFKIDIFDLAQSRFEPFIKSLMREYGISHEFDRKTPPRLLYLRAERLGSAKFKGVNIQPYRKPGLWPLLQRMWWRHKQYRKGLSRRVYG